MEKNLDEKIVYLQNKLVDGLYEGNSEIVEICSTSIKLLNDLSGTKYEIDESKLIKYYGIEPNKQNKPLLIK